MKRKIALVPLVIAGIVILFQFFGSEKYTNPETGKKARVALSPREETTLGLQSYREVLANSDTIQRTIMQTALTGASFSPGDFAAANDHGGTGSRSSIWSFASVQPRA